MADTVFIVGLTDYSAHVVANSYNIQSEDIYNSWIDGNGTEHRERYRTRLIGEFQMFFDNIEDFNTFNSTVRANKDLNLSVAVTLRDNLTDELITTQVFLDYDVDRFRKPSWDDAVGQFKIKVTER